MSRLAWRAAALLLAVAGCDRTLEPGWGLGGYAALSSPTIGIDGAVMFTTHGARHEVVCLAVDNGGFGWAVPLDDGSAATIPVVGRDGTAYVADGDRLRVIDRDGRPVEARRFDGTIVGGPAIGRDDRLYVAGEVDGGGFLEVTTEDGDPVWRRALDAAVVGQPLIRGDGVVLVETEGGVIAFDDDGERRWSRALDPSDGIPGAVGRDAAYLVRASRLVALDADGATAWSADGVVGSPALGHGDVVVPTVDGLVSLDVDDGAEAWRFDRSCGPAALGRDGHAYAGCADGDVVGIVEIDAHGDVVYEDAFVPGVPPRAAPVLASGSAILTFEQDVIGWDGAAPLAGGGSPRSGSDNHNTGRAR